MRAFTPEISWHNRLPALSLDISKPLDEEANLYRVATGGNDCRVYIWLIDISGKTCELDIKIRAGLRRHQKSVGVVRFSPQHLLASGDDDGYIYLWKQKIEQDETSDFINDDGFEDLETWKQQRVLRGHIEDICDLAWSKDGQYLLSGSVDNSAILWDIAKGTKAWCSDLIKGYVQGVAVDPHIQYMAAISTDRTLRIYNFNDRRLLYATRHMNIRGKYKAFFCDDTVQTFCRRLEFSPDGQYLLAPTAKMVEKEAKNSPPPKVEDDSNDNDNDNDIDNDNAKKLEKPAGKTDKLAKPFNVFLVFKRSSFNKPVHCYPTGKEVALCARFCPVLFKLRDIEKNFWGIPYRIVFAVVTSRSVLLYDSQQETPIGYSSQIHLARITDLAWSHDGRLLMVSSYDGYSTLITFDENEFGEVYTGPMIEPVEKKAVEEEKVEEIVIDSNQEKPDEKVSTEKVSKKATPRKIVPTRLPESATMWRYIVKK